MAGISKRQQILEVYRTRLQAIKKENGFRTNLGDDVLLGEIPTPGPDDLIGIAIVPGEEQVGSVKEHVKVTLAVEIFILAFAEDVTEPWVSIEEAIADVKQAIELPDRTLGRLALDNITRGPTRTMPRESGSQMVGASMTYFTEFTDLWGHPEHPEQ